MEALSREELEGLAALYDRFAHALDPFDPERDEAEAQFHRRLTALHEALAPATDIAVATVELGANRGPGEAVGEEKNQPRVTRSGVAPFQWTVDGSEN